MFEVENARSIKKLKITIENIQNNGFIILIFFEKNIATILLKNIAINIKK